MNLTETYSKSMKEILEECDIVEQKIHTDDSGNIQTIEVKYRPSSQNPAPQHAKTGVFHHTRED